MSKIKQNLAKCLQNLGTNGRKLSFKRVFMLFVEKFRFVNGYVYNFGSK